MRRDPLRVALIGLLAIVAGVTPAPSPALAQEQLSIAPTGTPTFPERSYRLTVPGRRDLLAQDIKVTENGEPVSQVGVVSADGARVGEFGSILVIDASSSMHGRAIRSAVAAARTLARRRSGAQQIGVVAFNRTPKVLLVPTDDPTAIEAALTRTPPLSPQTRIFDAVGTALDLLRGAGINAGSIVVLSDGSDTGSRVSPDSVARRARNANVAIYTVGLRSGAFDSAGLKGLATAGRGRYIAAESVFDLRRIFGELGTQLAGDYLVRYRSSSKPGREVTVALRAGGVDGVATSTYRVPGGATFVQVTPGFWTSTLGVALTAVLCALLLALGLGILLVRRGRGLTLRERVGGFVSMPDDAPLVTNAELTSRAPAGPVSSLERTRWWAAFEQDVEIARIETSPRRIATMTVLATVVVGWLLASITGLALVGLFALAIPWGVRTWVRIALERQRAQFTDQLPDILQSSASAIRAGHGLVAALSEVAEQAPEPSRSEFLRVVGDEALGVPMDDALRSLQMRMNSSEVLQIALVAQIQREAGGNMAEVLDRITDALRQRGELRRMVKALTAQGRLSRWVVTAIPLVLLLVVSVANPRYVDPMYTTGLGVFLLMLAGGLMLLGSLVIGKIVNFKV